MKDKLIATAIKAELKAKTKLEQFVKDVEGSDTTEKIGMVVVAVVIVGLLAAAVKTAMPGLFDKIMQTASDKLNDIFKP